MVTNAGNGKCCGGEVGVQVENEEEWFPNGLVGEGLLQLDLRTAIWGRCKGMIAPCGSPYFP